MKTTPGIRILLTSLLVAGAANAAPITGTINISSFNDDTFNVNYGTNTVTFQAGNNALVTNTTGSYTGLLGATVHYNTFVYSPFVGPINPLWVTTSLAPLSSFSLTSITLVDELPGVSLTLTGLGIASVFGFEDTVGSWSFTATQNGSSFGWDSINSPAPRVPDGGATLALLGVSVLGLGGMRRFLPSLKK
ncbi:MAG: VPDSG-CTERM sorting domain-containing protein [Verrucomicrobiota bacterium]